MTYAARTALLAGICREAAGWLKLSGAPAPATPPASAIAMKVRSCRKSVAGMDVFKQVLVCVALFNLSMIGSAAAQKPDQDRSMPPAIEWPRERTAEGPAINYAVAFGGPELQPVAAGPAQALLTAIVPWLSANFELPPSYQHPSIKLVPATEILFRRYRAFTAEKQREVLNAIHGSAASPGNGRKAVAIYDDVTRTIFLPEGWTGRTQAELSVLVHEMVHHLQKEARLIYPCPGASEKLAYEAQEKWLGLFGLDLESEFEIDPFTLLATTACSF